VRVAIAGGGTGGHLFPALAVAEVCRERGHDVLVFISEKEVDSLATRDRAEFRFEKLPGIGLPKLLSPAIFQFGRRLLEARSACRSAYKRFRPDAVLGMGGFTSTVPILEGRSRRAPTFLHESNAIPGKANRLNARFASVVFLGFADCAAHFAERRCEVTGTPIRRDLLERVPREEALASFGLDPAKKTLLIMGGSQGAKGINDAMIRALPDLKGEPLQAIHLAGAESDQIADANYRREKVPAHVAAFCHRMAAAYSAADFAVSRSGAASLAELSWFGLPSVLIPYPFAAEDHQTLNARIFERAGAAEILPQDRCDGPALAAAIKGFLADPARLEKMAAAARGLAPERAAERVVDAIEGFAK
jgi:UDP-N-acetylglucosamine--N-acetylmuramyl-(pentapeptide) pyrophosphoryl-undecaprenol N-acetylglucosamine transferase